MFITINGLDQWVSVHGTDAANPALLIVNGAGLALSRMAGFFEPWESAFRLIFWDRPGAGATLERNGETASGAITFDPLDDDGGAARRHDDGEPHAALVTSATSRRRQVS